MFHTCIILRTRGFALLLKLLLLDCCFIASLVLETTCPSSISFKHRPVFLSLNSRRLFPVTFWHQTAKSEPRYSCWIWMRFEFGCCCGMILSLEFRSSMDVDCFIATGAAAISVPVCADARIQKQPLAQDV